MNARDSANERGEVPAEDALEREWLDAIARGERGAIEALYGRYHARLVRFLSRHAVHRELIDEIINEVFWIVWRKADGFRGDSKIATWIIGITYRCMLKTLRHQNTQASWREERAVDPVVANAGLADNEESERRELRDWVARGLELLPSEQRMTIELAYYCGQSCEEIATIMDCAPGTVKARLFHARVRLRNLLPALGGEGDSCFNNG
ncbi:MAG: sigma-70 family RNA polymerase sigma factor [Rhodanobacteraceae bacterium]